MEWVGRCVGVEQSLLLFPFLSVSPIRCIFHDFPEEILLAPLLNRFSTVTNYGIGMLVLTFKRMAILLTFLGRLFDWLWIFDSHFSSNPSRYTLWKKSMTHNNLLHPHQIWTYLALCCSFFSVPFFSVLGFEKAFQVKQGLGDQTGKCWIGTTFYGSWLREEEFTFWAAL